jgi:hypothetical protein
MITVAKDAPPWAFQLALQVQAALDQIGPAFISLRTFTVAQLTASMAQAYPFKLAFVSNGAGDKYVAVSNGVAFYYLNGTAV